MLAFLDNHVPRASRHDPLSRLNQIEFLGELPGFGIVERDEVDVAQKLEEIGTPALDPEIHGVACDQLRLPDLLQDVQLQSRIDVGEKYERRVAELVRNLRAEVREYQIGRASCRERV